MKKYIAALATKLSIQPGNGSLNEAPIIEGLTIVRGKLDGRVLSSTLSAKFFEYVYVLGKSPRISFVYYSSIFTGIFSNSSTVRNGSKVSYS